MNSSPSSPRGPRIAPTTAAAQLRRFSRVALAAVTALALTGMVLDGSWGRWAIEVAIGRVTARALRGLENSFGAFRNTVPL